VSDLTDERPTDAQLSETDSPSAYHRKLAEAMYERFVTHSPDHRNKYQWINDMTAVLASEKVGAG